MTELILNTELIDDPRQWRLAMRLEPGLSFSVLAYAAASPGNLVAHSFRLDSPAPTADPVAAIEEAVYRHPMLLMPDFAKTDCEIVGAPFLILPAEIDAARARGLFNYAGLSQFPDSPLIDNNPGISGATLYTEADPRLTAFLKRTFYNVNIHHHLASLTRYFMNLATRGNSRKIYANFREGAVDIVATARGQLLMANSFDTPTADDATYYILAARHLLGMDNSNEPLMIAGNSGLREAATASLRNFVSELMPVIFPTAIFQAGSDAARLPFDLAVLPLNC